MYSCDPPTHHFTESFFFFPLLATPLGLSLSPLLVPFGLLSLSVQTPYRTIILFHHAFTIHINFLVVKFHLEAEEFLNL